MLPRPGPSLPGAENEPSQSFTITEKVPTRIYHILRHYQGRSCKQISWPPGIGGLQGVGLDPGQHDHHPHGVVHVGQLQDVQTVVPVISVIQEAHLCLITVSSSVMQFRNLLLFSTKEPGVKSWAEPLPRLVELASLITVFMMRGRARKAWGLRIASLS